MTPTTRSSSRRASGLTFTDDVPAPRYERDQLARSIVHIGVGGFHRAHLATYVHELCEHGSTDWSIVGAGVLANDQRMADVLAAQDGLYTLISRGAEDTDITVIGSIVEFVMSHDDPAPLRDLIAAPTTEILSLTITEGGYPVDDRSGEFAPERCPASSTFDTIALGLAARRARNGAGLTLMSCDNVMANGQVARTATLGACGVRGGDDLVAWVEENVSFPNSMVDRITPATSPDDIAWLADNHGIHDAWPVVAEPFRQWVVEDEFKGQRLPLEQLDVIVTDDIEPYELTKLRLLNAGHSCLAYLAALDGQLLVDTAMADPTLRGFVNRFLHAEAKPTLPHATGIDLDDYIAQLIERFSNPNVGDQIERLCLDGSSKFPKFLLPTIEAQLDADGPVELAALALAGWCEYLRQRGHAAAHDPLLDEAVRLAEASAEEPAAFLRFEAVFGHRVSGDARFTRAFGAALMALRARGVQSAVTAALREADLPDGEPRS